MEKLSIQATAHSDVAKSLAQKCVRSAMRRAHLDPPQQRPSARATCLPAGRSESARSEPRRRLPEPRGEALEALLCAVWRLLAAPFISTCSYCSITFRDKVEPPGACPMATGPAPPGFPNKLQQQAKAKWRITFKATRSLRGAAEANLPERA